MYQKYILFRIIRDFKCHLTSSPTWLFELTPHHGKTFPNITMKILDELHCERQQTELCFCCVAPLQMQTTLWFNHLDRLPAVKKNYNLLISTRYRANWSYDPDLYPLSSCAQVLSSTTAYFSFLSLWVIQSYCLIFFEYVQH